MDLLNTYIIAERKLYHERTNGRFLSRSITSADTNDAEAIEKRIQLSLLDRLIADNREGRLTDSVKEQIDGFIFAI
ncbi:Cytochrome P450 4C1, partial [Temnothorax longispinosus]